jgi:hypothetical protein
MKPQLNLHYVDRGGFIELTSLTPKQAVRRHPELARALVETLQTELRAYDAERSQLSLFDFEQAKP